MQKKVFERVLSMAQMFNAGLFHRGPNMLWTCRWSERGDESTIGFELDADAAENPVSVRLRYAVLRPGLTNETSLDYSVAVRTSSSYAGKTWYWYICPLIVNGVACQMQVRDLYFLPSSELFGCKHCRDLLVRSLPSREQRIFYQTVAPQLTGATGAQSTDSRAHDSSEAGPAEVKGWHPQAKRQHCGRCGCLSEGLFCCSCGAPLGEPKQDFLEILGIRADASEEDVRIAFKTRLKEYHPDKVASLGSKLREVAEEEIKRINLAYEALKDPVRRKKMGNEGREGA